MASSAPSSRRRVQASHESFLRHRNFKFLKVALVIVIIAVVGFFLHDPVPRANGGTWYGYTLGTISAGLILWLTMLGIRKRNISPGKWTLRSWTSAHVYLGLSLVVLTTLHSGFQFGLNIHTLAYAAMIVVVLSGLVGIYFYAVIPTKMGRNREEMTREQMVSELNAIDRQLTQLALPLPGEVASILSRSIEKTTIAGSLGSRLSGQVRRDPTAQALAKLRQIHPALDLAEREALGQVMAILERKLTALDRARRHVRYKSLLEAWLYVHVPMTFFLLAAVTAHIVSVFVYW